MTIAPPGQTFGGYQLRLTLLWRNRLANHPFENTGGDVVELKSNPANFYIESFAVISS